MRMFSIINHIAVISLAALVLAPPEKVEPDTFYILAAIFLELSKNSIK